MSENETEQKYGQMTVKEILWAKVLYKNQYPIPEIAKKLGRTPETIKKNVKAYHHLDRYVEQGNLDLDQELIDTVKDIAAAQKLSQINVMDAIVDEGSQLVLAKIRRHPGSIGVKEMAGAMKDVFTIQQLRSGDPSEIVEFKNISNDLLQSTLTRIREAKEAIGS